MNEGLELAGEIRDKFGTGAAKELRRKGMVPAVIYGADKEVLPIAIEERDITKRYRKPNFISTVIALKIGEETYKILPKVVDLHPVTDIVRHVDFVYLENKIQRMEVPIVYTGKEKSAGVKRGGFFNIIKRRIPLYCDVTNILKNVTIDVSNLQIGQSLKAKNIILPEGAKLVYSDDTILATMIGRKGAKAESEEAAAEGEETK